MEQVPSRLSYVKVQGAISKMSGSVFKVALYLKWLAQRHFEKLSVSGLTTPSWQWVHSEALDLDQTLSRCTPCLGEAERSDTCSCIFGVERIVKDTA